MLTLGIERRSAATPRGLLLVLAAGLLGFSGCGGGGGNGGGGTAAPSQLSIVAGNDGGQGSTDATGTAARFFNPMGIAMDRAGNIYVADSGNNTIRKITAAGVVTTFAGTAGTEGNTDGVGAAARFKAPHGLALDSADNVYVANSDGAIRKITPAGETSTLALVTGSCGPVSTISVDDIGNVYLAVSSNGIICKVTPAGVVSTFAGTVGVFGSADGVGTAASFREGLNKV
jgi:streptogramin lyase